LWRVKPITNEIKIENAILLDSTLRLSDCLILILLISMAKL